MAGIICKDLDNCNVSDHQSVKIILVPFNDAKHAPIVFGKALTIAKLYTASICVVSIVNKDLQRSWVNDTPSCYGNKRQCNVEGNVIRKSFKYCGVKRKVLRFISKVI